MSIATTQLTPDFLQALIQWQEQGNRSVKIEIERYCYNGTTTVSLWVWDSDILSGLYIDSVNELPSKQYLVQRRREQLEKEQKQLEEGVF